MKKLNILFFLIAFCTKISAAILVLNGLTHIHNSNMGSQVTGKIVVRNESNKEARILIYKQDLIAECGKNIQYTKINGHNRSLGDWLKTNIDEKLLGANEEYTIHYTIDIPAKNTENGTYWAVLMIEGADPIKEENTNGMQINSKVRYAIQVLADVGSVESAKIAFEDVHFAKRTNEDKSIKIKLRNEGAFYANTKVTLEIYSDKGEKVKTYEEPQKKIYPNLCNDFEIVLTGLPKGKYEGVVVADNGKDMFGSNITLEIE